MRRITPSSTPAAVRASRAGWGAAASALLVLPCLFLLREGTGAAIVVMLLAMIATFVLLSRHLCLGELASVGPVPVGHGARDLPLLPVRATAREVLRRLAPVDATTALVLADDGWRLVATERVVRRALATTGEVDVAAMATRVAAVAPDVPIDRLPRPILAGETWVVLGSEPPRALTRQDLFSASLRRPVDLDIEQPGEIRA